MMARLKKIVRQSEMLLWRWLLQQQEKLAAGKINFFNKIILQFLDRCYSRAEKSYQKVLQNFALALSTRPTLSARNGILFAISTLSAGGAERQAVVTLTGLKQKGFTDLTLLAFNLSQKKQRFYLPQLIAANIKILDLQQQSNPILPAAAQAAFAAAQKLPQRLNAVKICVNALASVNPAIVHLWLDDANIKVGLAAVALGVPKIILSTRNVSPVHFLAYQPFMREAYRWLVQQPGVIMNNNSHAGARAYEAWLGIPAGFIQVLHNGFDFAAISQQAHQSQRQTYRDHHQIPATAPVVGTVMRLSDEKNPLLWLAAAAEIKKNIPGIHFLVIGDGWLKPAFRKQIAKLGLHDVLHHITAEQAVFTAIAAMDLFLLTSRVEGLPNVLIEAQALGVPVVTTNAGGAAETLAQGQTGWVINDNNPVAIAAKVVQLLQDSVWLKQASEQSRAFVADRFSLEKMLDNTLQSYQLSDAISAEKPFELSS